MKLFGGNKLSQFQLDVIARVQAVVPLKVHFFSILLYYTKL